MEGHINCFGYIPYNTAAEFEWTGNEGVDVLRITLGVVGEIFNPAE